MPTSANALLGVLFLVLSVITTALMYQYWGYPYDEEKRKSACPQWKMNIHRGFGYAYVSVYVLLMIQMVPRLWSYQVEFPPRTVVHIMLGISIGVILLVKISILRFWRHFEEWMPVLGTLLLLCTVLLTGLSLPFAFRERALVASAPGGDAFSRESRARVARLLPSAGMPGEVDLAALAGEKSLREGREVLLSKCITCHDLRTVIAKPRTPSGWYSTVSRMAEKPSLGVRLEEPDLNRVAAYLVAITPDLQKSLKAKRALEMQQAALHDATRGAADEAPAEPEGGAPAIGKDFDPTEARTTFQTVCSMCHDASDVDLEPPRSAERVDKLLDRMIDNGLLAEPDELAAIRWYLNETYVEGE